MINFRMVNLFSPGLVSLAQSDSNALSGIFDREYLVGSVRPRAEVPSSIGAVLSSCIRSLVLGKVLQL